MVGGVSPLTETSSYVPGTEPTGPVGPSSPQAAVKASVNIANSRSVLDIGPSPVTVCGALAEAQGTMNAL